ncbi:DUF2865 domain-containing protein [Pseudahrensia aquimaris]|uniref:DUF2865 domain-containing protein n=1 Tax=Pseudahrensia aquimaris TaxID=744461 RepID=A0ABW3FJP4_9HYPH
MAQVQRQRARLKRALRRENCAVRHASANSRKDLRRRITELERRVRNKRSRLNKRNIDEQRSPRIIGTYRTMCVRTCDGFFFPVGAASSVAGLVRDEQACQSRCPGTEMKLYYVRGTTDEPSDMRSARTGRSYGDLPTALNFKTKYNPACGCKFRQPKEEAKASVRPAIDPEWARRAGRINMAVPTFRAHAMEQKNLQLASVTGLRRSIPAPAAKDALRQAPQVRIIGERFFPVR